jgi:integrase
MGKIGYKKLEGTIGIYQNISSLHYLAVKKVKAKNYQKSFKSLLLAKKWRKNLSKKSQSLLSLYKKVTLKQVWKSMQTDHFPTLAINTVAIWNRRYLLVKQLENLPMDEIIPSTISTWVKNNVEHLKSREGEGSGSGTTGRCNLNNELNLFVTIFNWYKQSERYEKEALHLTCPVKRKHKQLGFIKPLPDRRKQINLNDAILFFEELKPLYKDLATLQFYCAARIGEVAGLQWRCVNLEEKRMIIKHTCNWDMKNKKFISLKNFPKNKEPRPVYITKEISEILERRAVFRIPGNDFVFHVDGQPLNYGTIQVNYREAQRKSKIPNTGTHILRHGMAKLARKVGGGLDAVVAMTGQKDLKLANHYSKCDEDDQREVSEKIMEFIRFSRLNTSTQFC